MATHSWIRDPVEGFGFPPDELSVRCAAKGDLDPGRELLDKTA
jgi:hypothetical protein